jgi:hypothetical protein
MGVLRVALLGSPPPPRHPSLQRCEDEGFHEEDASHEGSRVGDYPRHVEELEVGLELKAHSARSAKQLHNEHDLPDESKAVAGSREKIGRELRDHDLAKRGPGPKPVDLRDLLVIRSSVRAPSRRVTATFGILLAATATSKAVSTSPSHT